MSLLVDPFPYKYTENTVLPYFSRSRNLKHVISLMEELRMKKRMLFGTVVSGVLAYAVVGSVGSGRIGLSGIVAGVLLTGCYLAAFWSGVTGWSSRRKAPEPFQETWSEQEYSAMKEELKTAA